MDTRPLLRPRHSLVSIMRLLFINSIHLGFFYNLIIFLEASTTSQQELFFTLLGNFWADFAISSSDLRVHIVQLLAAVFGKVFRLLILASIGQISVRSWVLNALIPVVICSPLFSFFRIIMIF